LNARAFTLDHHVHFGASYQPSSLTGEALLAHELTHVVQADTAASNPAQPTDSVEALEREARHVATTFHLGAALPPIQGSTRDLAVPLRAGPDDPGVPTFGNLPGDQPLSGIRLKLQEINGKWYEILPGREQYKRRAAGWYDFVVQDGEIWAVKARSPYGHTEAARGQRVELAGQIRFTSHSGQVSEWNEGSGHYRNSRVFAEQIGERVGLPVDKFKPHPERSSIVQLPSYQPKKEEIVVSSGGGAGMKRSESPTEIGSESPPVSPKPAGGTTAQKPKTTSMPKNKAPEPLASPKTTSPKISAPKVDQPSSPIRASGGIQEGSAEMQATARSIIESIEADFKVLRIARALTVAMHIFDFIFTLSTLNEFVSSAGSALKGKGFLLTKEIERAKRFQERAAESLDSYRTYSDLLQTKTQQLWRVPNDSTSAWRAYNAVSELEFRLWLRESSLSKHITDVKSIISSLRLKQAAAEKILTSPEASEALAMATFGTAEHARLVEIHRDLDTIDGELSQAVSSMEEMDKLLISDAMILDSWREYFSWMYYSRTPARPYSG